MVSFRKRPEKTNNTQKRTKLTAKLLSVLVSVMLLGTMLPGALFASSPSSSSSVTVIIDFEGYNLSQGFYIEPMQLTLPAGSNAADATVAALSQTGHAYENTGTPASDFYLAQVRGFDKGSVSLPAYITESPGFNASDVWPNENDWLGEFDYTSSSGWMYKLNDVVGQVGVTGATLQNGDVISWQFTLVGYGMDIGGSWDPSVTPLYTATPRADLFRALFADGANQSAKQTALDVIINPLATSEQVASAIAALEPASRTATVNVRFQANDSGFLIANQDMAVNSRIAEDHGYTDDFNGTQVSALDALVAAHIQMYGDADLGSKLAVSASGMVSRVAGINTGNFSFMVNGLAPGDGNYQPDSWNGGTSQWGHAVTQATIADGDQVSFTVLQDDSAMDYVVWFEQSGSKLENLSVEAGQDVTVGLKGYMGWYANSDSAWQAQKTEAIADAQIVTVGIDSSAGYAQGSFTDIVGKVTDAGGQVTLNFADPGTYIVSAYDASDYQPVISPWLKITVKNPVDKSAVASAVAAAEAATVGKQASDYTADSWKAYQDALAAAKALAADPDASQEAVDAAAAALSAAVAGLKPAATGGTDAGTGGTQQPMPLPAPAKVAVASVSISGGAASYSWKATGTNKA
ncbi:MAG: DUF4430 domain-containing protein, partial [Actinomycetia bacterium]|nr:DUF4430 domain-containing protein [Actinomycetes bacterium]